MVFHYILNCVLVDMVKVMDFYLIEVPFLKHRKLLPLSYIIFIFLFVFSLYAQEFDYINIPDTTSYTILAPFEVNTQEHLNYPIFFVSEINDMNEPVKEPPNEGLLILAEIATGDLRMTIFNNKEIKSPYLIKRKDHNGKSIYNYIYLWHQLDLKSFCKRNGKYQVFIISNKIRSNIMEFKLYGIEEEFYLDFFASTY